MKSKIVSKSCTGKELFIPPFPSVTIYHFLAYLLKVSSRTLSNITQLHFHTCKMTVVTTSMSQAWFWDQTTFGNI